MTTPSKRKGDRAELEIAKILADELGVKVRRKLGAGRTDDSGDLDGLRDTAAQVKFWDNTAAAVGKILLQLEDQRVHADATFAVGFVRRPGGGWFVAMTVPQFCTWYREATGFSIDDQYSPYSGNDFS